MSTFDYSTAKYFTLPVKSFHEKILNIFRTGEGKYIVVVLSTVEFLTMSISYLSYVPATEMKDKVSDFLNAVLYQIEQRMRMLTPTGPFDVSAVLKYCGIEIARYEASWIDVARREIGLEEPVPRNYNRQTYVCRVQHDANVSDSLHIALSDKNFRKKLLSLYPLKYEELLNAKTIGEYEFALI